MSLLLALAIGQGTVFTDGERLAMECAGVVEMQCPDLQEHRTRTNGVRSSYTVPGLLSCQYRGGGASGEQLLAFAPLFPSTEGVETIGACESCGWQPTPSPSVAGAFRQWCETKVLPSIVIDPPVLTFRDCDNGTRGMGHVTLKTRNGTPGPVIEKMMPTCPAWCTSTLPKAIDPSGVTVEFEMNASGMLGMPKNLAMILDCGAAGQINIPMAVECKTPLLCASPNALQFNSGQAAPVEVEIRAPVIDLSRAKVVAIPPCVKCTIMEAGPSRIVLRVMQTAVAANHHTCGRLLVFGKLGNEVASATLSIPIRHAFGTCSSDGHQVCGTLLMPGETVEWYRSPLNQYELVLPDRIPCGPSIMHACGWTRVGGSTVPHVQDGSLWETTPSETEKITLQCVVVPRLEAFMGAWSKACGPP